MNIEIWVYRPSKGQSRTVPRPLHYYPPAHTNTMWAFPCQFPECPCLSNVPHFPYFPPLFFPNSLPLPPFPPISPAAPVSCPLVPKPSKRVIFLKQRGNNLWRREQKEIFTAGVIKWIFARRMETVFFEKNKKTNVWRKPVTLEVLTGCNVWWIKIIRNSLEGFFFFFVLLDARIWLGSGRMCQIAVPVLKRRRVQSITVHLLTADSSKPPTDLRASLSNWSMHCFCHGSRDHWCSSATLIVWEKTS